MLGLRPRGCSPAQEAVPAPQARAPRPARSTVRLHLLKVHFSSHSGTRWSACPPLGIAARSLSSTRASCLHLPRVLGGVAFWISVLGWDRSLAGPASSQDAQFIHFCTSTSKEEWSALTQKLQITIFTHP